MSSPLVSLIIFFISVIVLVRSGSAVVVRLSRIARFFQISEFAASFVLIAFATSLPELFVGIGSALHGSPELSFSNIVGANIINLTLAAGIVAIIARGLEIKGEIVRREALYAGFAAFLPVLLFLDGAISRVDGVVLIIFVAWYFLRLLYQRGRFTKIFFNANHGLLNLKGFFKDLLAFILAVIFLVASAELLIRSVLSIASGFEIPIPIIGIILVALSTTLPEIAFGARAVMMGHRSMILGGLMGSVVVNSGLVLGITSVIAPINIFSFSPYLIGIIFTIFIALAFALFTQTNKKISIPEGLMLIAAYAVFVLLLFVFNGNVV